MRQRDTLARLDNVLEFAIVQCYNGNVFWQCRANEITRKVLPIPVL